MGRRSELEREQAYVSMLYERLDGLRERTRRQLERALQPDGGGHLQARLDRDAFVARHTDRLAQLAAAEDGLCFGRLDLRDGSRLYVGRIGLLDDDREPLLVDWRAPAAQPFYRATPAAPGAVVRRRHLRIRDRVVLDIDDDVLDLDAISDAERDHLNGEAALLASLARSRTGRMTDIVATIQAEQDRVIRADLPGILVVQGGPGTGKTVVALHRAAFVARELARRGDDGPILVTTFIRSLPVVLGNLFERLAPDVANRVEFDNVHGWASALLKSRRLPYNVNPSLTERQFEDALECPAGSRLQAAGLTFGYLSDEVQYFVKGRALRFVECAIPSVSVAGE